MRSPIKACVFDAYGTLFDVHSPVKALEQEIGAGAQALSATWRSKQLEYTWLRSLMGRYVPFDRVTADALDFALEAHRVSIPGLRDRLLSLYRAPATFADAKPCLQTLKQKNARTGILSNGSPGLLASAVAGAGLGDLFDYVLSVDTVQTYKPHPSVYQLAVNAFGVATHEIGFVSANGWDCDGAASFGFQVVHLARTNHPKERLDFEPAETVSDLAEAAECLGQKL